MLSTITNPEVEEDFRIRRLKKAHFSSVPTRMIIFTTCAFASH
ncbi:hypothetical protein [Leptospira interrogans]|nr:hypothetical protein [Leptospira interrogans]